MTMASISGILQVLDGDNPGFFKISAFISATSVEIISPSASGADSGNPTLQWREVPRAPFISATQLALKNSDGTVPSIPAASSQAFRVVRPVMSSGTVFNARSLFNAGLAQIEVEALDLVTGDPFDVFTPGMVGLLIDVSGSDNPVNDGVFLITEYIHSGKVVTDSGSSTSDTASDSTVRIG